MDKSNGDGSVGDSLVTADDVVFFDLESERMDFDLYTLSNTSDTESSIYDCSLDESFRQIKTDLDRLHSASPIKQQLGSRTSVQPPVVDDDLPEIDINERFDVMKNRVRNYRDQETETIRHFIVDINRMFNRLVAKKGKKHV